MNRKQLLEEIYNNINHNILCFSKDELMTNPKKGSEEQWNQEQEKLEIIKEMLEEENKANFILYTSLYNIKHNRNIENNVDLAVAINKEKALSCHLSRVEINNKYKYELHCWIHDKDNFDDKHDEVYTLTLKNYELENRATLKQFMEQELIDLECYLRTDQEAREMYKEYIEPNRELEYTDEYE